jgi:hypothetical protein
MPTRPRHPRLRSTASSIAAPELTAHHRTPERQLNWQVPKGSFGALPNIFEAPGAELS